MIFALKALLSAGLPLAALLIGYRASLHTLPTGMRDSCVARVAVGLGLGVALCTPVLIALAAAGWFPTVWLGALGWAVSAYALQTSHATTRARLRTCEAAVLFAVVVYALVAAIGRDEAIGGGRDQQIYAEFAVMLANEGTFERRLPNVDAADRELLAHVDLIHVPGTKLRSNGIEEPFVPQLPLGWTVWLAFAYAIGAYIGLYAANAAVFAWGGLLFFVLARQLIGPMLATGATIALLMLPSSLWAGGIGLSEPMAMSLLLCVPILATNGLGRSRWWIAIVMITAALVRIDSLIVVPALMAAALVPALAHPGPRTIADARGIAIAMAAVLLVTIAFYAALNRPYLLSNSSYLKLIALAVAGTSVALMLPGRRFAAEVARSVLSRGAGIAAACLLVVLFAYAALFRPSAEPFSLIMQQSWLNGTRDFREDSIRNLAVYVSWPMLIAALGGASVVLARGSLGRGGGVRPLIVLLALGPALLYLWFPHVSPDHPWAVRRFVPTVIPYVVLFAGILVAVLTRRAHRTAHIVGALALAAAGVIAFFAYPPSTVLFRDNRDLTRQLAAVAAGMPDDVVVSVGLHESAAAALLVAFGKPVVNLDRQDIEPRIERWIEAKARLGRPAWLLHGPEVEPSKSPHTASPQWLLTRGYVQPANQAPASQIKRQDVPLSLTHAVPPAQNELRAMFGSQRLWGTREGGFYNPEIASFGTFRFTTGKAGIDVPVAALQGAQALKFDLFTYAGETERRWVKIHVADKMAWEGTVPGGIATVRVPMPSDVSGETVRLTLLSETISLAKSGVLDRRDPLGVGLIGVRALRADDRPAPGSGIQGFRSRIRLLGGQPLPLQIARDGEQSIILELLNAGTHAWPVVREIGGPQGAVQIAVRWHLRGEAQFVGDNRVPMSVALHPGDQMRLRAPLKPVGLDGKRLPPGEYDVHLGMVRETVALFADNGDAMLTVPVVVHD